MAGQACDGPAVARPERIGDADGDAGEPARRRVGHLSEAVVAPADEFTADAHPARMAEAGGDVGEPARRRRRLPVSVVAPAGEGCVVAYRARMASASGGVDVAGIGVGVGGLGLGCGLGGGEVGGAVGCGSDGGEGGPAVRSGSAPPRQRGRELGSGHRGGPADRVAAGQARCGEQRRGGCGQRRVAAQSGVYEASGAQPARSPKAPSERVRTRAH